jgi:hypothetical protein
MGVGFMRIILFLLLLTGFAPPAWAADPPVITTSDGRVTFNRAHLSVPARVGTLAVSETKELSHPGEGLDSVVLFRSSDQEVLASVYVYYPAIAHSGLAAIATDAAIRANSSSPVTALGSRLVAAAGHPDVAVRADYRGYLGKLASSAAFIKTGRWMIKLRVSGPEARKAEVDSAMAALLDGLRIDSSDPLRPAVIIDTPDCAPNQVADARVRPDVSAEIMQDVMVLATLDPTGNAKVAPGDSNPRQSRIGDHWCRRMLAAGTARVTLLQSTGVEAGSAAGDGKSHLFVLYSDAGGLLEVVRRRGRYALLNHKIGQSSLLASFDSMPSDGQLIQVLSGNRELGRHRAEVRLKANGNADVNIFTPPAPPTPRT